jgi:uncharacterized membrane protein
MPHLFRVPMTSRPRGRWSFRRFLSLVVAVVGVALTLAARQARADLQFTNYYPTPIFVAFAYPDGYFYGVPRWRSLGWYFVDSGQTVMVFSGRLAEINRYWYGFAVSADGRAVWTDDFSFRVSASDPFDYLLTGDDHAECRYLRAGFFEMEVRNYDDFDLVLD